MSKSEKDQIESWMALGIISAALGALLLSKNKKAVGVGVAGLIIAAVVASITAREKARETKIPLITEENNALYEVYPDGSKKLIKKLDRKQTLPKNFTIS